MPTSTNSERVIEYRVCWAASSSALFKGQTDWERAGDDETAEEIENSLNSPSGGGFPAGLDMALEASGFEWWVETREAADA